MELPGYAGIQPRWSGQVSLRYLGPAPVAFPHPNFIFYHLPPLCPTLEGTKVACASMTYVTTQESLLCSQQGTLLGTIVPICQP